MAKTHMGSRLASGPLVLVPLGVCLLSACVAADRYPVISRPPEALNWLGQAGPDVLTHAEAGDHAGLYPLMDGEADLKIGDDASANRLSLSVERRDRNSGRRYDGHPKERWRNALTADALVRVGVAAELGVKASLVESLRTTEGRPRSLLIGSARDQRQTAGAGLELSLGLGDDRLRFTTSQSHSNFRAFDDDGPAHGFSVSQRLDADLIRSGALRLSAFASHSLVDGDFVSSGLDIKRRAFERRDRRTFGVGTTIGSGPVELTLSQTEREKVDQAEGYRERSYEALVNVALADLWNYMDGALGGGFWAFAPGSVWFKWAPGQIDPGESGTGQRDSIDDHGIGLSWSWDSGYADLGFWRYIYDSQQRGAEDADWIGHGLYGDFGLYGETWSIDAGLGSDRGNNEEFYSRSRDASYDGSISFSRRSAVFPDIALGLSAGRYGTEYIAYGGDSLTDYWELNAELDFTKFLTDDLKQGGASLRAVYGFHSMATDDDFAGKDGEDEHVLGFIYKRQL